MAVRARFYVAEVTRYANGATRPGYADPAPFGKVVMRPVTRGEENRDWASATPAGAYEMTLHGGALDWFSDRVGAEVSIVIDDA